jgi:hypothetical protein
MFPVPDGAARAALAAREPDVSTTYALLIDVERRRLAKLTAALAASPRRTWLETQLDTVAARNVQFRAAVSAPTDVSNRAKTVDELAALFSVVQRNLDDVGVSVVQNRYIAGAIKAVQERIVGPLVDEADAPRIASIFRRLFGQQGKEAQVRMGAVLARLTALDAATDGAKKGFVLAPAMPAGAAALAHGNDANAYIDVSRGALNGSFTVERLAATLVHEASHTLPINPTIDYLYNVYPEGVYFLRDDALLNAASYEQVVLEVLGKAKDFPADEEISDMRGGRRPRIGAVHTLLASRVSRAWVRILQLNALDYAAVDVPTALYRILEEMPHERRYAPLINAYMQELADVTHRMMLIRDRLAIQSDPNAGALTIVDNGTTITAVIPTKQLENDSVDVTTTKLLHALCDSMTLDLPKDKASLARLIDKVEEIHDGIDAKLLTDFYKSFQ